MRVAFLGSGSFAVPSLHALLEAGHDLAGVWSQPDRPVGRGLKLTPPPVKAAATLRGLGVFQPRRIREPEAVRELQEARAELHVVVAYGQILPRTVLEIPPRGTINVHASLLPRYRGAAPVQWAIVRGDTQTGVTTMLLDEGLDTGPLLLAQATPIGPEETAPELERRLAGIGAELLLATLRGVAEGTLTPRPQDDAQATLAPLLRKEDGRVDWRESAGAIARRVRGLSPWPGTTAGLSGRSLRILKARAERPAAGDPGEVVGVDAEGVVVACGEGTRLRLLEVQPESRRAMPAFAFASGARLRVGQRLD